MLKTIFRVPVVHTYTFIEDLRGGEYLQYYNIQE